MPDFDLAKLLRPLHLPFASMWEAASLEAPSSPEGARDVLIQLTEWLKKSEVEQHRSAELFLQMWKIGAGSGNSAYAGNIGRWLPRRGTGVWPGRRPPQRLTAEIAMDCAAAVLTKDEQPLASYPVVHVSAGREAGEHALHTLFGGQMTVQLMFPDEEASAGWALASKNVFLPTITDSAYRHERFYLPLFDGALMATATDDQLDRWMCGATGYLRESPEDKAVLLVFKRIENRPPLFPWSRSRTGTQS